LKKEVEREKIYNLGRQGGVRQVVVATFRLVPENLEVGASIQLVLVKTKRL
jgi:hypothetical protein